MQDYLVYEHLMEALLCSSQQLPTHCFAQLPLVIWCKKEFLCSNTFRWSVGCAYLRTGSQILFSISSRCMWQSSQQLWYSKSSILKPLITTLLWSYTACTHLEFYLAYMSCRLFSQLTVRLRQWQCSGTLSASWSYLRRYSCWDSLTN